MRSTDPAGVVAEVLGPLLAAPGVEEEDLRRVVVVEDQRVQRPGRPRPGIARRRGRAVPGAAAGRPRTRAARAIRGGGRLAGQLVALDQPVAGGLAADVGDGDQAAAGQHVEPAEQLAHPEQDGRPIRS